MSTQYNLSLVAVITTTLSILGLALAGSVGQRLWAQRQKRAEDSLNRSEEKFRALVDAVKDYAIFMLDLNGRITTWNRGAERITGYSAREIIGQHVSIFYTKEDLDRQTASEELREATTTGHFEGEAIRVRRDGSTFWANIVLTPLFDNAGRITGFSKVTRDITSLRDSALRLQRLNEELERRVADRTRELARRESQLTLITNALPVLVGQLDRDEKFLFVNEALAKWFGRTKEQMVGATFREVLGEDRYHANEPFIQAVLAGRTVSYERHSSSTQRKAFLNITLLPEFDPAGSTVGFILVANDVAKYKEIETELTKAKLAADVASETKSAFLANMSHEIRTPVGAILGFSELLASQEAPADKLNALEVIKRNGRLLSKIINDILDISKVEAGKLEVDRIDLPFNSVLPEIESLLNLNAVEKGVQLKFKSEGTLPTLINTDPLRLRQILMNIIGNAIKFTKRGSVTVTVKTWSTADAAPKLAFVIKDTGEGIAPDQAIKLFAPFTQADASTTRRFGGTGLGLILSKRLANALGGDVILSESFLGVGSTFVITIDPGMPTQDFIMPLPARLPQNRVDLTRLRVLVVDDSLDNQALIKRYLNLAGAEVETADNGREGLQKALKDEFNVILMDLQMPEMDGYEATRALRSRGYQKPILALTAHAMKEQRLRCLESGFNDHLTKPIERETLLKTLAEYSG